MVLELRALYRSAARGQASAALFIAGGGLGNHRYQNRILRRHILGVGFAGLSAVFTATAAKRRLRRTGATNIGGHMPGAVDPELFHRVGGSLAPSARFCDSHTKKPLRGERRIWAYPEQYRPFCAPTFQLRYALEPYLYTEARRTYDTGRGVLPSALLRLTAGARAYDSKGEYLFCDQMLAAPITAPATKVSRLATEKLAAHRRVGSSGPTASTSSPGPAAIETQFPPSNRDAGLPAPPGRLCPCSRHALHGRKKPVDR